MLRSWRAWSPRCSTSSTTRTSDDDEDFVSVLAESDFDSPFEESPPDASLVSLFFFELSWASFSRARFFVP